MSLSHAVLHIAELTGYQSAELQFTPSTASACALPHGTTPVPPHPQTLGSQGAVGFIGIIYLRIHLYLCSIAKSTSS